MSDNVETPPGPRLWILGDAGATLENTTDLAEVFDSSYLSTVVLDEGAAHSSYVELLAGLVGLPILWLKAVRLPRDYDGRNYVQNLIRAVRPDIMLLLPRASMAGAVCRTLSAQTIKIVRTTQELNEYCKRAKRSPK